MPIKLNGKPFFKLAILSQCKFQYNFSAYFRFDGLGSIEQNVKRRSENRKQTEGEMKENSLASGIILVKIIDEKIVFDMEEPAVETAKH